MIHCVSADLDSCIANLTCQLQMLFFCEKGHEALEGPNYADTLIVQKHYSHTITQFIYHGQSVKESGW